MKDVDRDKGRWPLKESHWPLLSFQNHLLVLITKIGMAIVDIDGVLVLH